MSLGQVQIIQSLAEALSWYEKELTWEANPSELNHLVGRIGELYAAMITSGTLAINTNQRGYDIIDSDDLRVSVKTVTTSTHVSINPNTIGNVDRFLILRLVPNDPDRGLYIEKIGDFLTHELGQYTVTHADKKIRFMIPKIKQKTDDTLREIVQNVRWNEYTHKMHDNQSVTVWVGDNQIKPAKPILRKIAADIGVELHSPSGTIKNTRFLGAQVIKEILNQYEG